MRDSNYNFLQFSFTILTTIKIKTPPPPTTKR